MKKSLFCNALIHTGVTENEVYSSMLVENGRILRLYHDAFPAVKGAEMTDLHGKHVYPCLIDSHVHLLLTVAVMAMGFSVCEITSEGVKPDTLSGVEKRVREYAADKKPDAIIACSNYILSAIDVRRMPAREELDAWGGGRAVVIYNIDGHSTSLSSRMLQLIGIDPEGHSGVLQGEENERAQGRITDLAGSALGLADIARGVALFQNRCAEYGICISGALEGNGDSPKDSTTALIVRLARHFDVGVRLYLQYTDLKRVGPCGRFMKNPRIGGCGDWEMDGSVGSHSAAFAEPFRDTLSAASCYYSQSEADRLVVGAVNGGFQIASHAIGGAAIERLLNAYDSAPSARLNRIEHCEFPDNAGIERICQGKYAVMMQPGYAWIDKRWLHTYESFLPDSVLQRMPLRTFYDAGVCVCASSDSPVQDIDPYLQMLGMTEFYRPSESLTPYQAFRCYTVNAARAIEEEQDYGTLEEGKIADFFVADKDLFILKPSEIADFRPLETYYGGRRYIPKKGTVAELLGMLLRPTRKI